MKKLKYLTLLCLGLIFSGFSFSQNNLLVLNGAITVLNGGTSVTPIYLVVNQNNSSGIVRSSGHIHSENQFNYIKWVSDTGTGNYIFPFGVGGNSVDYIPFTFNKTTNSSSDILLSTWATNIPNFPRPSATNVAAVSNMINYADSVLYAIDRFWDIQTANNTTADLTFSYRGVENTTANPIGNVRAQHWNGSSWDSPVTPGSPGVTSGIGTAGVFVGQNTFSPWVLSVVPICPEDTISYSSSSFCNNDTNSYPIFHTNGLLTGTYSSSPIGLGIDTNSGEIIPSASIPGTYTVTFTVPATFICPQYQTSTIVVIDSNDNASFSFNAATYCLTGTNPIATVTGTVGGTFTISAPGVINATTGEINLLASGIGTFTITYNTASAGNPCPQQDSTTINITSAPTAGFSYNVAQSCQNATNPVLTFDPGASAGVFSSTPAGLTLNPTTGAITLSSSAAGIYTVYNTIAAAGGCASAIDSATIEVQQMDSALFGYTTGGTYCLTGTNPIATVTGTVGGTFTISAPGVINSTTGEVDLLASGLGTFTVTYNTASAGNPCPQQDSTTIDILSAPGASFSYTTPYCQDNGTATPVITSGSVAGTFSSNPSGVVFVNTSTGEINLVSTPAGVYTIYNNVAASGGCSSAVDSFVVTINESYLNQETASVCSGGSYTFPDGTTQTNITTQVVYTSNLTTTNGCDSIVETTVNVNPTYFNQETASVCSGGNYTFPDGTTQTNITTQVVYTSNLTTTNGCDSIIETTVNVNPQLSVVADTISPICNGDNLTLTATGSGNGTITWYSDAAGNNVIGTGSPFNATSQITGPGIYTFYVNETGACSSALTAVNVVVGGVNASITATPTTGFMPLTVAFGNNSSTGATVTYTWLFGDGSATSNQNEPTHTYNNMGNYIATLIVTDGVCYDTASVVIEVVGQSTILIPNVFTPNADGSNDVFTVKGTNLESVEGEIYNRWGQKLFSWNGVKGSWDGRTEAGSECPDGTYFYIIKAKGLDGADYHKTGAFSLIR